MTDETAPDAPRPLRLDHFLKREQATETGGDAKQAIQSGLVTLNGVVETRRKKKLKVGDVVVFDGRELIVRE
jgi:ribosome-associated protein